MPESADEVTVMEVRTVRRRLTQSTLFPHKVQESSAEKDNYRGENRSDGDDREFGGSQGRRKRKAKVKGTPQAKSAKKTDTEGTRCLNGVVDNQDSPGARIMKSPRKPREKKQTNRTPKKANKNSLADSGVPSTCPLTTEEKARIIPDLRLEAKLIAEENSRIFGGKQIHPFFSSRKSCKATREPAEAEANSCTVEKNNSSKCQGPIHVYDSSQDGAPAPDWSHWTFLETSIFNCTHVQKMKDYIDPGNSIFIGKVSCPSSMSSTANGVSWGHFAPTGNSSTLPIPIPDEDAVHVIGHNGHYEFCLDEKKSSMHQIRSKRYNCWDKDVLWTKKYQPESLTDVCGNIGSVKYLSEWLNLWHAKALQCKEFSNSGTKNSSQSGHLDYYESDCDSEKLSQGAELKNVLLVSGPTGSGKSASIYACAREQGFKVIEVNTSDWRNGSLVKQKFGEAVESHRVKRLSENETSHTEPILDSLNRHTLSQETDNEVVEWPAVDIKDGNYNPIDISAKVPSARSKLFCNKAQLKTLVLFDDVDIAFTEDRGFISAIQHLSKTAKLPIILTTNSNQSILPDSLVRDEICFSRPSLQDLVGHVTEICTAEKASIEPSLVPSFIECFHGDIRKTIMHLQFWCQNAARVKDTKMLEKFGPQVLDLEAAHQRLMRFIPWGFASELSELIEFELNKSLSMHEEYLIEVNKEKHLSDIGQQSFQAHLSEECMEAKKDAMLKRNTCYGQFEAEVETQDTSNSSGSPIAFTRRNIHIKSDYVLSLSGDDDIFDCEHPTTSSQDAPHAGDDLFDYGFVTSSPKPGENFSLSMVHNERSPNPTNTNTPFHPGENFESQIQVSENNSQIQDSCGLVDLSCVPESSFVPETRINDDQEESCRSVSYAPSGDIITTVNVQCYDECLSRFHSDSQNRMSGYDLNVESIHLEDVGDSHTEHLEVDTRLWQVMDECSQMNFNKCEPIQHNDVCTKTGSVQEAWTRLRGNHQDLGKYVTPKQKYASRFLRVAFGATNLLSDADILLSDFSLSGNASAEPSTTPSEESDASEWYSEQLRMASTISDYGLSMYAEEATVATSKIDQTSLVDSAQEMLSNSSDTFDLGAQGAGTSESRPQETLNGELGDFAPSEREANSNRLDIIRSIVPPRSYLAVRGELLHEYISSLNTISRSETSRLSAGVDITKRRRGRLSRHYLSDELSLSSEDITILKRYPFGSHGEDA